MADENERGKRPAAQAEIVNYPNTIKAKVSGGGPISKAMLERAKNVIEEHGAGYVERARAQIESLQKTVQEASGDVQSRPELFAEIFLKSHDIRGLGSTFGYDLITEIGTSLCTLVEGMEVYDDDALGVVRAHVDALRAIIAHGVKGDGGEIGREISNGLAKVVAKLAQGSK